MPFVIAVGAALVVAVLALGAGALSAGGTFAAVGIGAAVLSGTGWGGALVLGAFFVPSTLVGRLTRGRPSSSDAKGECRDAVQVLANGWAAALGATLLPVAPGFGLWVVTSSLAAAAADTWATSTGLWSRSGPRLVTTGRRVPAGTSGAVSGAGSLGAVAGAVVVAAAGAAAGGGAPLLLAGTTIGFVGMLLDSVLGAVVQARRICPECGGPSERSIHRCGSATRLVGGFRWLNNDGVNALTTGFAAALGALGWWWWS